MHHFSFFRTFAVVLSSVFSLSLFATVVTTNPPPPTTTTTTEKPANVVVAPAKEGQDFFTPSVLETSAIAAQAWLKLVDMNKYGESWDKSTTLTKLTVSRDEWIKILDKTRRPLGSVTSRQVLDQRTAINPSGMPKGYYIVMFYKTVFSHKTGFELLTLYFEDNQWSALTYQVTTE